MTNFRVVIQPDVDERYKNLAEGTKGPKRYLIPTVDVNQEVKVSEMWLYRSAKPLEKPNEILFDAMTTNINEGRGGSYLYLVWRKHSFRIEHSP